MLIFSTYRNNPISFTHILHSDRDLSLVSKPRHHDHQQGTNRKFGAHCQQHIGPPTAAPNTNRGRKCSADEPKSSVSTATGGLRPTIDAANLSCSYLTERQKMKKQKGRSKSWRFPYTHSLGGRRPAPCVSLSPFTSNSWRP